MSGQTVMSKAAKRRRKKDKKITVTLFDEITDNNAKHVGNIEVYNKAVLSLHYLIVRI